MGGGDGWDGGGSTLPILNITTPDQPPHGGLTGSSSSSSTPPAQLGGFFTPCIQRPRNLVNFSRLKNAGKLFFLPSIAIFREPY